MSTRKQLRESVYYKLKDINDGTGTYSKALVNDALNDAVQLICRQISRKSKVPLNIGRTSLAATSSTLSYNIQVTDFHRPKLLRRETDAPGIPLEGGLGRRVAFGLPLKTDALLIAESEADHPDYAGGICNGRQVAYIKFDDSQPTYKYYVVFIASPISGTWVLQYYKKFTKLDPTVIDTGVDTAAAGYSILPEDYESLVVYQTAVMVMGIHKEDHPLVMTRDELAQDLGLELSQGRASGVTKDEQGWGSV